ncbi:MAG TPA: PhnD/SsuA/transferrin family substrate-binding protein [bacterium]
MRRHLLPLLALTACLAASTAFASEPLHLVIMAPTDPAKELPKYEVLSAYLQAAEPQLGGITLRVAKNYSEAARLFKSGDVEGMFSGSFVAAVFIGKGLARPVARPLRTDGSSTYRASIVAKDGARAFGSLADFKGKRVAACPLATAGEVFLRALLDPGQKPESVYIPVPVDSHQQALEAVLSGAADYAVVKSTIFAPEGYPGLTVVGMQAAGNPDTTLIMPSRVFERIGPAVSRALLGLETDTGEKARAVKEAFGCTGFIATTGTDFEPTFSIMRRAGVDLRTFDFAF